MARWAPSPSARAPTWIGVSLRPYPMTSARMSPAALACSRLQHDHGPAVARTKPSRSLSNGRSRRPGLHSRGHAFMFEKAARSVGDRRLGSAGDHRIGGAGTDQIVGLAIAWADDAHAETVA